MTTPEQSKRGHTLTIVETDDHTTDDPDYDLTVNCVHPPSCGGWQECGEEHLHRETVYVGFSDASAGPYSESAAGEPWEDEEEFEFHGVLHSWRSGWGWTIPFPGCVVAENDGIHDSAWDIARDHGPGTYVVDDDWFDETSCDLRLIGPVEV